MPIPSEHMIGRQPTLAERAKEAAAQAQRAKIAPGSFLVGFLVAIGTPLIFRALGL